MRCVRIVHVLCICGVHVVRSYARAFPMCRTQVARVMYVVLTFVVR